MTAWMRDLDEERAKAAERLRQEVEKVLVVTVDAKSGEIIDALVQPLDGFIRALAEAAQKKAETGEPVEWPRPSAGGSWWRPQG